MLDHFWSYRSPGPVLMDPEMCLLNKVHTARRKKIVGISAAYAMGGEGGQVQPCFRRCTKCMPPPLHLDYLTIPFCFARIIRSVVMIPLRPFKSSTCFAKKAPQSRNSSSQTTDTSRPKFVSRHEANNRSKLHGLRKLAPSDT